MPLIMQKLQQRAPIIYIVLFALILLTLLASLIPALTPYTGWMGPPQSLFIGLVFALICGQAWPAFNKWVSKYLLQYSVVGLGFGMNLHASLASGKEGMVFTIVSVAGTLIAGIFIGRMLTVNKNTSWLIGSGTAICGGSAIAAVGPVIQAKESEMSVALGTIFILNSLALFIFPLIGQGLHMNQIDFGMWAAIAIHDTSSVVGAGAAYGEEALRVATTVKLTRALWIIPLTLLTSLLFKSGEKKITVPWFIFFFILAMAVNTWILSPTEIGRLIGSGINSLARKMLSLTLFCIGASLSPAVLKSVGLRPLVQATALWVIVSLVSLAYILFR